MNPMFSEISQVGFLNQALAIFSAMLFVVWIVPGMVQRIRPSREDR